MQPKQKTELQKVDSVIGEYKRKLTIAGESLLVASENAKLRLIQKQNELISEINRLLMVKTEMMARVKRQEEQLILMIALRRNRLRSLT